MAHPRTLLDYMIHITHKLQLNAHFMCVPEYKDMFPWYQSAKCISEEELNTGSLRTAFVLCPTDVLTPACHTKTKLTVGQPFSVQVCSSWLQ